MHNNSSKGGLCFWFIALALQRDTHQNATGGEGQKSKGDACNPASKIIRYGNYVRFVYCSYAQELSNKQLYSLISTKHVDQSATTKTSTTAFRKHVNNNQQQQSANTTTTQHDNTPITAISNQQTRQPHSTTTHRQQQSANTTTDNIIQQVTRTSINRNSTNPPHQTHRPMNHNNYPQQHSGNTTTPRTINNSSANTQHQHQSSTTAFSIQETTTNTLTTGAFKKYNNNNINHRQQHSGNKNKHIDNSIKEIQLQSIRTSSLRVPLQYWYTHLILYSQSFGCWVRVLVQYTPSLWCTKCESPTMRWRSKII